MSPQGALCQLAERDDELSADGPDPNPGIP